VKIGAEDGYRYLRAWIIFCSDFPHSLSDLGQIYCKRCAQWTTRNRVPPVSGGWLCLLYHCTRTWTKTHHRYLQCTSSPIL